MSEKVSIIIPTYNEKENLHELIYRIDKACVENNIQYEILFIDDHSQDNSEEVITSHESSYPIFFYTKVGPKGKAQSLLEGFSHAKYQILCMIDADLQYPPEAIPIMIEKLHQGTDVVIAETIGNGDRVDDITPTHFAISAGLQR